jgi:DNA-binding IclR family transcriptional regulator
VQAQPGITIPELAARMGIKQNYLYRVLPSLEEEGKVAKQGRGWHPKGS